MRKTEYRYKARGVNEKKDSIIKWPVTFDMLEEDYCKIWMVDGIALNTLGYMSIRHFQGFRITSTRGSSRNSWIG